MKIGKSIVQFNTNINKRQFNNVPKEAIPYWKLYSRDGDCIQERLGYQWCSTRALTYKEIVDYLQNFDGHRVLEAYPRMSTNTRRSYQYQYDRSNNELIVLDKYTVEVLYIVNAKTKQRVYLSPDYKKDYFYNKFYYKQGDKIIDTWLTVQLLSAARHTYIPNLRTNKLHM